MTRSRTDLDGARVRRVPLAEGELRLRVTGRGPPVLCLHGLSAHGGVWHAVARRLEERYTLYLPDLLGRGSSEPRDEVPYGLDEEVGRIRSLLEALDVEPKVVVGHSQGAALALALTADAGPRWGLVLACPVTPWTRRPAVLELLRHAPLRRAAAPLLSGLRRPLTRWILRARVYGNPSRADLEATSRYAAPYADPRRARALLRVLADWRPEELAGRIPARPPPARVLAGGRDRRIRPREARRLAERLGAGFEVVAHAGHLLPEEAPETVARGVDEVHVEVGSAS